MDKDPVEEITKGINKLAVDKERRSFNFLVKTWITAEEREYNQMRQLADLDAELTLGKQPETEADWARVLTTIYGQEVLDYLLSDKAAVQAGVDNCLEETKTKPEPCRVYDWLDRSEAGFLKFPPRVDWVETSLTSMFHEQKLEAPVALGVGLRYAAILARPKNRKGGYSVYCADMTIENAFYANNVMHDSIKEALGKVGFNKLMKHHSLGELCCYSRSSASFETAPDSGFVSGNHVVLCWPNTNTGSGFFSRFHILRMPVCYTSADTHCVFDVPVGSVSELCMLYPYIAFSTNTAYFGTIDFLRNAKNYDRVAEQLRPLRTTAAGKAKEIELVVTYDISENKIHRVIPVPWGAVSNVSLFPRMTSPLDANIPLSNWKISWNILNEAQPYVHGHTFTQPFFITEEDARREDGPLGSVEAMYWNSPTQELIEEEQGDNPSAYSTSAVEPCRGVFHFAGGHVVQISDSNMSTFVAKNGTLFPEDKKYHARQFSVVDCVVHAGIHIVTTPDGRIQFSQLRIPGKADLVPQFAFTDADLTRACGRKLPEGVSLCKDSDTSSLGQYKAIWVSASFRVVVQMSNGLLIFIRPRTIEELRQHFENSFKAEAERLALRTSKIVAQKQLKEAHAYGVEPVGVTMAREEAFKVLPDKMVITPNEKMTDA